MTTDDRIRQLHDSAVKELVNAHRMRTDEPLVLAVRFAGDDPNDIYLLEVLVDFPGGDEDELLSTEFEPSAQLRILGQLHLVLASPAQVKSAVRRGDAIVADIKRGTIAYDDGSPAAADLRETLAL